ncbi:hypothetical protein PROFUN_14946 [Planoprotostelium fungivorum]|uniref:Peroxisomal ATPase PEX6 n=1 Tax=Planoprotostelium fungivorum TaxID=1890364 RepID=A0A2P6MY85_9EUKA|nr:hypothetical protein PROFUN_14946 [Planoprotostelium fungivorum]
MISSDEPDSNGSKGKEHLRQPNFLQYSCSILPDPSEQDGTSTPLLSSSSSSVSTSNKGQLGAVGYLSAENFRDACSHFGLESSDGILAAVGRDRGDVRVLMMIYSTPGKTQSGAGLERTAHSTVLHIPAEVAHSLGVADHHTVHIRAVKPSHVTLDHVILSHRGEVTTEKFRRQFVLETQVVAIGRILRIKSHGVPGSLGEYKVVNCYPYYQGVVDASTTIIVRFCTCSEEDLSEMSGDEDTLVLESSILPQWTTEVDAKTAEKPMKIRAMPLLHSMRDVQYKEDGDVEAGVTLGTLRLLHIYNRSWIKLYNPVNESTRLARVSVIGDHVMNAEHGTIYLTPFLVFNLGLSQTIGPSCRIEVSPYRRSAEPEKHGEIAEAPQIAREVTSNVLPDEDEYDSDDDLTNSEMAYFKVTKIVPEGAGPLVVDSTHTTMFQEGAVQSLVPGIFPEDSVELCGLETVWNPLLSILRVGCQGLAFKLKVVPSVLLHSTSKGCGKRTMVKVACQTLGIHLFDINCYELLGPIESHTQKHLEDIFDEVKEYAPAVLHLRNIDCLEKTVQPSAPNKEPKSVIPNAMKECMRRLQDRNFDSVNGTHTIMIVGSTHKIDDVSGPLRGCFRHDLQIESASERDRKQFLESIWNGIPVGPDVTGSEISSITAGLNRQDLRTMMNWTGSNCTHRILDRLSPSAHPPTLDQLDDAKLAGFFLSFSDFERAVEKMKGQSAASAGAPKIPKTSWNDVGGLFEAKKEILDTIQLPLLHPEMFAEGVKSRSGVLLYGPPGTGKTLMAKAVATECNLNFISVKGPEMINMYVGESEKNIRDLFARARSARPCVIFFDELDSLAPNRGNGADSGGVMDRVVSQLLAELSGLQKSNDLFVIGATNRPDLLDPALLTPGRFDRLVYLGINEDHPSQLRVLKALTRKWGRFGGKLVTKYRFKLGREVDLKEISERCPLNLTGADFYALASDALLTAMTEQIERFEEREKETGERAREEEMRVTVEQHHFIQAIENLTPSVSPEELTRYKQLQSTYSMKPK